MSMIVTGQISINDKHELVSGGGVIISHAVLINKMNFCIYVYSEE